MTSGIRGEFRRFTSMEVGAMIRLFREQGAIKRAVLAAEANVSEKTVERAEAGGGINEESCRRIATALGLKEDAFTRELYIPTPEEAVRIQENAAAEREKLYRTVEVEELRTVRIVLSLFEGYALIGDSQCVAEKDLTSFAELKQAIVDWGDISRDVTEPQRIEGAQEILQLIRDFEALGYVVKGGTAAYFLKGPAGSPGSPFPYTVIVAFRKPKGSRDTTPSDVFLPRRMPMSFA